MLGHIQLLQGRRSKSRGHVQLLQGCKSKRIAALHIASCGSHVNEEMQMQQGIDTRLRLARRGPMPGDGVQHAWSPLVILVYPLRLAMIGAGHLCYAPHMSHTPEIGRRCYGLLSFLFLGWVMIMVPRPQVALFLLH